MPRRPAPEQPGQDRRGHLRFHLVYRSLVRAKVASLRLGQADLAGSEREAAETKLRLHMGLADRYVRAPRPRLILMHGLAGSGKTHVSRCLMLALPAVRVRSDVERKRCRTFTPGAGRDTGAGLQKGIYSAEETRRTYERLCECAHAALDGGLDVIVDAACLRREQRARFAALARRLGVAMKIVSCAAPEDVLRRRLEQRAREGEDASDADVQVLAWQRRTAEPIAADESGEVLEMATGTQTEIDGVVRHLARGTSQVVPT